MGWWVVVNNIGSLLFLQIDLILVNLIFGATPAGEYAIALQWAILLRAIGGVLSGVLTPTILSFYARGQLESMIRITKSAVKLMGIAMALPVGFICGFAPQILSIWIGPDFARLAPLMVLLTVHLTTNLAVLPLFTINVAHNMVRVPGVVTFIMGICYTALAVALSLYTDWGYYGIAAAGAIVLTAKNAFFTPWYATRVLGIKTHTFTWSVLFGIMATIILAIFGSILVSVLMITNIAMLILAGVFVSLLYVLIMLIFGLNAFERDLFVSYLPLALRRFIP